MRLSEAGELLALISAYDNRNTSEEVSAAWYDLLTPYTLHEAKHAAKKHFHESTDYLMPAHIVRIIKAERRARLAKVETIVPSRADMTDTAAELTATKALSKAIASGELTAEQYEDYRRGNTPWTTYRRGLHELRGAA
ncbi:MULTISPECIES: hypothetical protein [unclassified Brevibacterium]|uniref:hypothetical protein n=1 Tax=unclassified Brevibacterium TaxID=2614124 RepID=UPI001E4215F8|nr:MULTISPECIES: hypothetical protein [unclassified Brevibacterium]MCD1287314.1 hypothetical protein [Brevibacterium sp. CCUG 69071]MDK8436432.1 hypothetical protein [Brevibacterium sp. H-BE7]